MAGRYSARTMLSAIGSARGSLSTSGPLCTAQDAPLSVVNFNYGGPLHGNRTVSGPTAGRFSSWVMGGVMLLLFRKVAAGRTYPTGNL